MDLQEWELLPDDGFLEIHNDGGKKIFSRKFHDPKSMFQMDYFICPDNSAEKFVESSATGPNKQLLPLPIHHLDSPEEEEVVKQVITKKIRASSPDSGGAPLETDHDPISQVFFKKMKENEFIDMKMDSPRSSSNKCFKPHVDPGALQFEKSIEDEEALEEDNNNSFQKPEENSSGGGLNLWKWSLNGFGAICSFGVVAATICIIILGGRQKNNQLLDHHHQQQTRKVQFHIFSDEKRVKQVVVSHATRLNDAISAARGVPVARAHISFGGYFDGL